MLTLPDDSHVLERQGRVLLETSSKYKMPNNPSINGLVETETAQRFPGAAIDSTCRFATFSPKLCKEFSTKKRYRHFFVKSTQLITFWTGNKAFGSECSNYVYFSSVWISAAHPLAFGDWLQTGREVCYKSNRNCFAGCS